MEDPRIYREAVGSLIYLATCTRPDLSYVVSKLSQHFAEPSEEHWNTAKHVFRYLKKVQQTVGYVLKRMYTGELGLIVHSDADWASEVTDRRSTTGYCASFSEKRHSFHGRVESNQQLHCLPVWQNTWP